VSGDRIQQYREICHCGHDKATHFPDVVGPRGVRLLGACLGVLCDCTYYITPEGKAAEDAANRAARAAHVAHAAAKPKAVAPPPFHRWPLAPAQVPPPAPSSSGPSWSTIPPAPDTEPLP